MELTFGHLGGSHVRERHHGNGVRDGVRRQFRDRRKHSHAHLIQSHALLNFIHLTISRHETVSCHEHKRFVCRTRGLLERELQGYLTDKKPHPPRTLPQACA